MSDPKAAQEPSPFQPDYERQEVTDEQLRALRDEAAAEVPVDTYFVHMVERALGGDVSAVNACKLYLYARDFL